MIRGMKKGLSLVEIKYMVPEQRKAEALAHKEAFPNQGQLGAKRSPSE